MTNLMTSEQFENLADIYGANIKKWPTETQASAINFSKTETGQNILSQAQSLDQQLDGLRSAVPKIEQSVIQAIKIQALSKPQHIRLLSLSQKKPSSLRLIINDMLEDLNIKLSPKVIIAQGTAMAFALCLGLIIPYQNTSITEEEYDISGNLFAGIAYNNFSADEEE